MSSTSMPEKPVNLEKVIDSDRYRVTGFIDRGCWGAVYSAIDKETGREVAVKVLDPTDLAQRQMQQRNLDGEKAMKKEAAVLAACSNVVPRILERDNNRKPFIVMPHYPIVFANVLNERFDRHYLDHGHEMSLERVLGYARDIANGLAELHTKLDRVHGDLKPDNLVVDQDKTVLITDLGSSSIGTTVSPRDNIGFEYTRAPECWVDGNRPTRQSDVWAFGSLLYRMFTGKYIFEDELGNAKDPTLFMIQLDQKVADVSVKSKLKNVPRKFRKFLKHCLAFNSYKRFSDGVELKKELDLVIENLDARKAFQNHIRKFALPLGLPLGAITLLTYVALTHEPTDLTMPEVKRTGTIYPGFSLDEKSLEFDREELDLPQVCRPGLLAMRDDIAKLATDNRYVAYLLKTHNHAWLMFGGNPITESMEQTYSQYTIPEERQFPRVSPNIARIVKSIEVALSKSKNPEGKIDLEDVCAITRLGEDKVNEARRTAGSFAFKDYLLAKDKDGNYIIPENEQTFIKTWLSYIK